MNKVVLSNSYFQKGLKFLNLERPNILTFCWNKNISKLINDHGIFFKCHYQSHINNFDILFLLQISLATAWDSWFFLLIMNLYFYILSYFFCSYTALLIWLEQNHISAHFSEKQLHYGERNGLLDWWISLSRVQ